MLKKHPILFFILGILLLTTYVVGIVFLVKTLSKDNKTSEYTLAEFEEIVVDVSDKELTYFESFSFIGKTTDEIKTEFKNVVLANKDVVKMQNIKLLSISGTLELYLEENVVKSYCFTTKEILSADDAIVVANELNTRFSSKMKQNKKDFTFFSNGIEKEFASSSDLYNPNSYLITDYEVNNTKVEIKAEKNGDKYCIKLYN